MISRNQVNHVAHLAALKMSEDEAEQRRADLDEVLSHVERIAELELSEVKPTTHVVPLTNVLRPDLPQPSAPREKMLKKAPDPAEGAFRVPSTQAEA
jgi:aspartyl-tRNA(Asn)/glutamyl-tRNA(Gln) amidotransferase subunit C